jgi:ABC-type nitrate/sulfonate/bicarbonate transport system permease component
MPDVAHRVLLTLPRSVLPIAFAGSLILAWEICTRGNARSATALPPFSEVMDILTSHYPLLLQQAASTAVECTVGFLLAVILGIVLGAIIAFSSIFSSALYPQIIAFQIIPKIALAPLFIVWLGVGASSRLAFTVFSAFFPVAIATVTGLRATPANAIDLCLASLAPRWRVFLSVRFPFALPHIFSGLKIAVTMALIGEIVAEFITAQVGLGYIIKFAASNMETALVLAALFLLCGLGFLLFGAVSLTERLVMVRYGE